MTKLLKNWNWNRADHWQEIRTVDLHTGGEPLRVITGGIPEIPGDTILAKRNYFRTNLDHIRKAIIFEPRGHADMYAAVLTDPVSEDSDFGTFFLHNAGYSTMCGHAIIALVKLVLDTGIIKKEGGNPELIIDAPPGKIHAKAKRINDQVASVSFKNVPSFVYLDNQEITIEGIGKINYSIAYGGAFYVYCDARAMGLSLAQSNFNQIIDYGRRIKHAVRDNVTIEHPFEEELSFLYGTIFIDESTNPEVHSKNVCIFADGELDRSATGSGVSGRAAIHYAHKDIKVNEKIIIESILESRMSVRVIDTLKYDTYDAVIPQVSGMAYITGQHSFLIDPSDPLKSGFIFR